MNGFVFLFGVCFLYGFFKPFDNNESLPAVGGREMDSAHAVCGPFGKKRVQAPARARERPPSTANIWPVT